MRLLGKTKMTAAAALMASAMLTTATMAAPAVSPTVTQGITKTMPDNIQTVRDGRGWGRHGHRRGGWGRGAGWGLGAAAAAGLLLSAPYLANGYGYDDDDDAGEYAYRGEGGVERCEATFRSFDPASGTYMGYDGIRRPCPYL